MPELIACEACGLVQRLDNLPPRHRACCARCDAILAKHHVNSRARTLALTLSALFLYAPANIYPIMTMEYMGRHTENTVWGGVKALYQDRMWYVAIIVFAASMVIPLLKLLALFFLVASRSMRWRKMRARIFKITCRIGPWAMLDVFLLSVLVALIRFGRFATVIPGPGIIAFTSVVVLTILAAESFDPRIIWQEDKK